MNQAAAIYHEVGGQGTPLVILHGLFGDSDNFKSIVAQFEPHFQVFRLDLPSHGQSKPLSPLSFANMASAIETHLIALGLSKCHILGHSLGGKVAMQLAGNTSKLAIEKLIIVDIAPKLYPPHHTGILAALNDLPMAEIKSRGDADKILRNAITDPSIRGFLLKSLQRSPTGEYTWRFDLPGITSDYEHMRQSPSFAQKVMCPTLFIKGSNSDYIEAKDEPAIRTHFNDPRLKTILGTGHWPHAEKPDLFARLCLEFLKP